MIEMVQIYSFSGIGGRFRDTTIEEKSIRKTKAINYINFIADSVVRQIILFYLAVFEREFH